MCRYDDDNVAMILLKDYILSLDIFTKCVHYKMLDLMLTYGAVKKKKKKKFVIHFSMKFRTVALRPVAAGSFTTLLPCSNTEC